VCVCVVMGVSVRMYVFNWLTYNPCVYADPSGFILFPLVVHSFDLVISSVGILSIRGTRDSGSKSPVEDPMSILEKGYSITIVLAVLTFGLVIFHLLGNYF
jgi:Na+/H+-translocating membrane pyrophosphatase